MSNDEMFFGKDCPDGMVQVESVITRADPRTHSDILAGWKPGHTAAIELYVGGRRFIILAGEAAKMYGHDEAGIVIQSDVGLETKNVAVNSVLVTFSDSGERIWRRVREGQAVAKDSAATDARRAERRVNTWN